MRCMHRRMYEILYAFSCSHKTYQLCVALQKKRKFNMNGVRFFLVFLFSLFILFISFLHKKVAFVEVFNLHACPRCLRGGFHPGIFIFSSLFFAPGLPQRGFKPWSWPQMLHRAFHLGLLFSNFQECPRLEAMKLPITFNYLLTEMIN